MLALKFKYDVFYFGPEENRRQKKALKTQNKFVLNYNFIPPIPPLPLSCYMLVTLLVSACPLVNTKYREKLAGEGSVRYETFALESLVNTVSL